MKNRIISLSLVATLSLNTTLSALPLTGTGYDVGGGFTTTTNGASEWKDPLTGMNYYNFGSKHFKFNSATKRYVAWAKVRPPSVNAGCGGVSLDGGFAAFLDLEEIGKQLETAISSVGMGVIVALLQTMPSLAKAFEDVQKLVRKIQQLLQNSCQMTSQYLSNNQTLKDAKDGMESTVMDSLGVNYLSEKTKGITETIETFEESIFDCTTGDAECAGNAFAAIIGLSSKPDEPGGKKSSNENKAVSGTIEKAIIDIKSVTDSGKVEKETIENVLKNGKWQSESVPNLTPVDRTLEMIKAACFGVLAVPYNEGISIVSGYTEVANIGTVDLSKKTQISEDAAKDNPLRTPTYRIEHVKPLNDIDTVVEFLAGEDGITHGLKIPGDLKYALVMVSDKSSKANSKQGSLRTLFYLEKNNGYNEGNYFEISWNGIEKSSYETILHAVDPRTYPAPAMPISPFMPAGASYVDMIKKYAKKDDREAYALFLAKVNVKYAVKEIIDSAKKDALVSMRSAADESSRQAIEIYIQSIQEISKKINIGIDEHAADLDYLNNMDNIFKTLKERSLERKFGNVKAGE